MSSELQEKHFEEIKKLIFDNFKGRELPCAETVCE